MACLRPYYVSRPRKLLGLPPSVAILEESKFQEICRECDITRQVGSFVPCGKCSECLKRRQQDLAARCASEASKCGSMVFVTLTYREETLPICVRLQRVDKATGEVTSDFSLKHCTRRSRYDSEGAYLLDVRSELCRQKGLRSCDRVFFEDDDFQYRYIFSPTLNSRDVRLWLKRRRVAYERDFGDLPKFKYVCVGEYGNHGSRRPHYHLCFFGLSKSQVEFFCSEWSEKLGFTYVQDVKCVNEDGTDGFALASRYIGKYMSKGVFDSPSVVAGYVFKTRIMSSKGLGGVLPTELVDYYRCTDIFGDYSLMELFPKDKLPLLCKEVLKRMSISFGKSVFRLPNKFIQLIWYVKDFDGRYRPSIVRRQMSSFIKRDAFSDFIAEFTKLHPDVPRDEVIERALDFQERLSTASSLKNERGMFTLQKFYLTSKF